MTTVAWDGSTLASDSLITFQSDTGFMTEKCQKVSKYRFERGVKLAKYDGSSTLHGEPILAIGGSGSLGTLKSLLGAAEKGMEMDKVLSIPGFFQNGAYLLVVTKQQVWIIDIEPDGQFFYKHPHSTKLSIGSGSPAAELVMKRFGLSAPAAVAVASTVDEYTDAEVRYMQVFGSDPIQTCSYSDAEIDELFEC